MSIELQELYELYELSQNKTQQVMLSDEITVLECVTLYKLYNSYLKSNGKDPMIFEKDIKIPEINISYEVYTDPTKDINGKTKKEIVQEQIKDFESELYNYIGADNVNTFQHAYGTAILMERYDENVAREIMLQREKSSARQYATPLYVKKYGGLMDSYRDLHNNEVGIRYKNKYVDLNIVGQRLFENLLFNPSTGKIDYYYNTDENRYKPSTNLDTELIYSKTDPRLPDNKNDLQEFYKYLEDGRWSGGKTFYYEKISVENVILETFVRYIYGSFINNKLNQIQNFFNLGKQTISPLILDLDGDGVETLSLNEGINFDHNADGFSELTGWASPDDGLLVLDINDNGLIDSGRELFGEHTLLSTGEEASGGFEALTKIKVA